MTSSLIGAIWVAGLVSLQSIPGTGALRTFFLLAGITHLLFLALRSESQGRPRWHVEAVLLGTLTVWLVVQSAFIAPRPADAVQALASEWPKFLLMTCLGIAAVRFAGRDERGPWIAVGLFVGHFLHVLSTLLFQAISLVRHGGLGLGNSFLGNYGYVSPFVTGALAFLLAEAVIRLRGERWLPFSHGGLILAILATLIAQGLLTAKAGLVASLVLLIAAMVATAKHTRQGHWVVVFATAALASVFFSLMVADRWRGAATSIAVAIRQPVDVATLDGLLAGTATDKPLDESFYLRARWARLGLEGIAEHPFGLGYGANAFGRYIVERGGASGAISSHSGWIDFALANGIPGLALLLTLGVAVMWRGWRSFLSGNPAGLACVLVTLNFFVRSAIDGMLAGSRFTGFAFCAAALWALATRDDGKARHESHAD
jgi:hypothetical protein